MMPQVSSQDARPTRTRPVAAEAEEAEASAAEVVFSAATEFSDAGGGVPHPTTTAI